MIRIRYKPNHESFGRMLLAPQTQKLARTAAEAMIELAAGMARAAGLPERYITAFHVEEGPIVVLGGNPRRTARAVNDSDIASAVEFGSGVLSTGASAGEPRPQGGYSAPYRFLGKAGATLGSAPMGDPE